MTWNKEQPTEEGFYWVSDTEYVWVDDLVMYDGYLVGRFGYLYRSEYNDLLWGDKIEAPKPPEAPE
jgi:hypothetical protein